MADLINNGALTPDGKKLIAYIEAQIAPALADKNPAVFNTMSGALKFYAVNVALAKTLTPEGFVESYPNSAASLFELVEALAQKETVEQVQTTTEQVAAEVKSMSEQFAELQQQFAEQKAKLEAQEAELKSLREAKKPDKKKSDAAGADDAE